MDRTEEGLPVSGLTSRSRQTTRKSAPLDLFLRNEGQDHPTNASCEASCIPDILLRACHRVEDHFVPFERLKEKTS